MKLRELIAAIAGLESVPENPALDAEVTGLCTNSHACKPGNLFLGMPGTRVDGGDFWQSAIAGGAVAAIVSPTAARNAKQQERGNPCLLTAADMTVACAEVANAFYGYPTQKMDLVGVTGTNGKTTTTHLIEFLLARGGKSTALLGTLYARWPGFEQVAVHTTPFAVDLQKQLASAASAGAKVAAMEVSSHALAQNRVLGCQFDVGVFTNLTQDHLDYHQDMEDYFQAKAKLFDDTYLKGRGIINADDPYGSRLIVALPSDRVWSYSTRDIEAALRTSDLQYQPNGVRGILHTPMGETPFELPLVGQYNLENMLAAVGAALHFGVDLEAIVAALPEFPGVPGRMERVWVSPDQDISAIVDYAHTPDSLKSLLEAARPFISGKTICVFGCGGDRDRTKRPLMGKFAAELADVAVVTSDNPRTEDPDRILEDVLAGIPDSVEPMVIADRAQAIRTAILQAKPGDGVLIAGKGHEDYQILGTEKIHFDDREQARAALFERLSGRS